MDSRIKELFERYQSGDASIEERRLVEDWFAAFDSQQQKDFSKEHSAELFVQMDRKIGSMLESHPARNRMSARWLQVAAVFLIGAGLVFYKTFSRAPKVPAGYTLISVPKGVKKQLSLPDGSTVYLNSGSTLRISPGFGVTNRRISLTGEGFFIVKHNQTNPFTIQSGRLIITDIGTSFNVKAYAEESLVKVAVESGEVNVKEENAGKEAPIFPKSIIRNQQLIYSKDSRRAILNDTQTIEVSAWRKNQLRFDNASFGEIATTLERWYGVTVNVHGHTDNRRYTVSFNNEPVSNVLKVLGKLSGMSYQVINKSIQINLKPNKSMK
ncbi:FecR family protein [Mucilaginibacter xinganensis]|uniref:FecR family protein n=1 Tax=Mucilaginibacter xinganensis TaxID=1234841 RepID=UPI0014787BA2|nr:FecR family protein [Mucilaginibacter xinganensis]